ncbi:MAG: hypothetical protein ABI855_16670 [Bacteroidota bacterium]
METWNYVQNQFLNSTDNSFKKAVTIAQKHDSALFADKADPFILVLYTFFHPLYVSLNALYDALIAVEGTREGSTLNIRQKLRLQRNPKARHWDNAIQKVYDKESPEYKALLPNGRTPFQAGPQLMRINAINILSKAIGTDPLLADLKTELDAWFEELNTDYNTHEGDNSDIKKASDKVELARVAMCEGMYKNMADLMSKYYQNPQLIEKYFPLDLIRNGQQVDFTKQVKAQKVYFIVTRTLTPDHEITLINEGNTELQFYFAQTKKEMPGAVFVTIPAHSQRKIKASDLGNPAFAHILVFNPDTVQTGKFTLELV